MPLSWVLLVGLSILSFIVIVGLSNRLVETQSSLDFAVKVNERGIEILEDAVAIAEILKDKHSQEMIAKEMAMAEAEALRVELHEETTRKEVALAVLKLIKRDLESSLKEERRLSEEKAAVLEQVEVLNAKLTKETDVKTAALNNLKALEGRFKAATEESMRVESVLAERLNMATTEAETLRVKIGEEAAAKVAVLNNIKVLENQLGEEITAKAAALKKLNVEIEALKAKLTEEVAAKATALDSLKTIQAKLKRINLPDEQALEEAMADLTFAQSIHQYYLDNPDPKAGSSQWQQYWIDVYKKTIQILKDML